MKLSSSRIYGSLVVDLNINLSGKINGLTLGNIAEINKNESTSQFLRGDGSWATPSQTSHADVLVDGDFTSNGFMKRTAAGVYAIDSNTYNPTIGTDLNHVATDNADIIHDIYLTDGVITSFTTTTLTLGDLGYTGDTDATNAGATGDSHAGITTGNPHNLDAADVGALPAGGTAAAANLIKVNSYDGTTLMRVLGSHQTGGSDNVYSTAGIYFNASTDVLYTSGGNSNEWNSAYDHSQVAHAPSNAEANVKSDWDATTGDAEILNKPTNVISQVSFTGGTMVIEVQ